MEARVTSGGRAHDWTRTVGQGDGVAHVGCAHRGVQQWSRRAGHDDHRCRERGGRHNDVQAAPAVKFGKLASPCGPGQRQGRDRPGRDQHRASASATATTAGYAATPGLDQEMGDAVKGMIKWCNDQGGINGRQISGDFHDAAITRSTRSCSRRARTTSCSSVRAGRWTRRPSRPGSGATWRRCPVSPRAPTSPTDP